MVVVVLASRSYRIRLSTRANITCTQVVGVVLADNESTPTRAGYDWWFPPTSGIATCQHRHLPEDAFSSLLYLGKIQPLYPFSRTILFSVI